MGDSQTYSMCAWRNSVYFNCAHVCVLMCKWWWLVIKLVHLNATVIQTLNCSDFNIKITRGEDFLPLTMKNGRNSIMAVHACVKGFGGEVFLWCFNGGGKLKNSGQSFPATLNDKGIKITRTNIHILVRTQTRLPNVNLRPNNGIAKRYPIPPRDIFCLLIHFCSSIL